jgi:hypothetical protein
MQEDRGGPHVTREGRMKQTEVPIVMPYLALDPRMREVMSLRAEPTLDRAPLDAYRAQAPRAVRIYDALMEGGCDDLDCVKADPLASRSKLRAGGRCRGLFLVDTRTPHEIALRVLVHYGANTMKTGSGPPAACAMNLETTLDVGDASDLEAAIASRFARGPVRLPPPGEVRAE